MMRTRRIRTLPSTAVATVLARTLIVLLLIVAQQQRGVVVGFRPTSTVDHHAGSKWGTRASNFLHYRGRSSLILVDPRHRSPTDGSSAAATSVTTLNMFMGSDGGFLGIGGPELATILLVGYFILGPSDLYKLVKEIGKFITNARTLGNDLTTTFENNMESQFQLEEIRKAQRELNDAFNFRRSINVDAKAEAFSTNVDTPRVGLREGDVPKMTSEVAEAGATAAAVATTAGATITKPKKIRRRRRVVKTPLEELENVGPVAETIPEDLEMPMGPPQPDDSVDEAEQQQSSYTDEELALIDQEFDQYVAPAADEEWPGSSAAASVDDDASTSSSQRFQQQLSGNWNEQILQNEDKLSPIATVMQKLALLEEEKIAATKRLNEEFERRAELENSYYRQQRSLLEGAVAQVQNDAYMSMSATSGGSDVDSSKTTAKSE